MRTRYRNGNAAAPKCSNFSLLRLPLLNHINVALHVSFLSSVARISLEELHPLTTVRIGLHLERVDEDCPPGFVVMCRIGAR